MMWLIVQVWYLWNTILNYQDWWDIMRFITKTRQNNNVTDCTGPLYAKNGIELPLLIGQDTIYHEKQTR